MCAMEDMLSTLEDEISLRTGRAVKQQREAAGFSLRVLAARSGISSSMISDIERGTKSPTVTTVVRLAQALGVSAAALIDGGTNSASAASAFYAGARVLAASIPPLGKAWDQQRPAAASTSCAIRSPVHRPGSGYRPCSRHDRAYARGRRHRPCHRRRRNGRPCRWRQLQLPHRRPAWGREPRPVGRGANLSDRRAGLMRPLAI